MTIKRGYTIIELIIVLAVLSAMTATAYPMLQKPMAKIRLKNEAQKVIKQLSAARLEAMQDGRQKEFNVVVPDDVDFVCNDVVCYPDGSIKNGNIILQQDKLSINIVVCQLTQSAKMGDCYER
jgi:prepilin-type N-terminal cleavage/methylation domain-containing protein